MIDLKENELINVNLAALYKKFTPDFLKEWEKAFEKKAPPRINEFGVIDIEKYDADSGVLFIGKETNGWNFSEGCLFRKWLEDITKYGFTKGSHVKKHPQIWYNVGRWSALLKYPDISAGELASLKSEVLPAIGNIAFTNINKVYGYKQSKDGYYRVALSCVAGEVLRQEIEIIKPKAVVCCGTGEIFLHHVKNYSGKVIFMPHPAARASTEEILAELKKQL